MINARKGTAHSLAQSDFRGKIKTGEGVVAGMVVRKNTNGEIVKGVTSQGGAVDDLIGFAINNQDYGDVIASGVIGAYALDGSVIDSDQNDSNSPINATNYPVGKRIAASTAQAGKFKPWTSGDRVIGYSQGVVTVFNGQTPVTCLSIQLGE